MRQLTRHTRNPAIDHTRTFNIMLWCVLLGAVGAVAVQGYTWAKQTLALAEAGRVACEQRFHPEYLKRCNIQVDGLSCSYANRSRLSEWYEGVDYACARAGPHNPLIAPVMPHEGPSLKPQEIAERAS